MTQGQADNPRDDAFRRQGIALCRQRRFEEAATAFARYAELKPDEAAPPFLQARASFLARDWTGAREACQRALKLAPDFYRGHLLMTLIAVTSRNLMLAQAHLQSAVRLRPKSADLRARLAEIMASRSQFKTAMEMAASAYALDPNCFAARAVIARCQVALGQLAKAQSLLDQLEGERPGEPAVAKIRNLLTLRLSRNAHPSSPASAPKDALKRENGSTSAETSSTLVSITDASAEPDAVSREEVAEAPSAEVANEPWSQAGLRGDAAPFDPAPRAAGSLRPTLVEHLFIIRALILRNLRLKYRDNPFGIAMELIRPVAVVVAHYFLFWILHRPMPGNAPIASFVLGGFSVWFAFNATEDGAATGGKYPGGVITLTGVTDMHLRAAKALWSLMLNLTFCLVALAPLDLYGADLPLPAVPQTFLIFFIAGAMGFGFGLLVERLSKLWPLVKPLEKLLSWALFVSAGLYFSIATMHPPMLARVMWYNPLLHLIEYQRNAFDSGYPIAQVTLLYPSAVALLLLFLGLVAIKCLPTQD